jgi:hypothetical protein
MTANARAASRIGRKMACHLDWFCWSTSDIAHYTQDNQRCALYNFVHRHIYQDGPGAPFKMKNYAFEEIPAALCWQPPRAFR